MLRVGGGVYSPVNDYRRIARSHRAGKIGVNIASVWPSAGHRDELIARGVWTGISFVATIMLSRLSDRIQEEFSSCISKDIYLASRG